jgi:anaerobic ribonucleoside-triphosphate reductase activating protein
MQTIRLYGLADDSIVDGPGVRLAVFVQGCSQACPGCHNPQAQPYSGGYPTSVDELVEKVRANPLLAGITLTGGEPFDQAEALVLLAKAVREIERRGTRLSVWAYSGYLYEHLLTKPACLELLKNIDVLVDGPYLEAQRNLDLQWRGSANQRVIDVPTSLVTGSTVLL